MAFLINRKAPSRIECLHSLVKFLYANYGFKKFGLIDCMYSREEDNIHNYCSLVEDSAFGKKCPYKESPLGNSGCYITNGKLEDTTKKKEVGNTINALHGMGFVKREDHDIVITKLGEKFAKSNIFTTESYKLISKAILSYGPVVGVVDEIEKINKNGVFEAREIAVGYPISEEVVYENGMYITISSGSTDDANTRSRSCYLSWLVTAGVIEPLGVTPDCKSNIPYMKYRSFLNEATLSARKYKIIVNLNEVYKTIGVTEHPLDFINLTKRTMALRENGQEAVREATMKYESRIQNRRFAIMYLLNEVYNKSSFLSFNKLYKFLKNYKELFVISNDNFEDVLKEELHIANVGGIPFNVKKESDDIKLYPKVGVNLQELSINAPLSLINVLKSF